MTRDRTPIVTQQKQVAELSETAIKAAQEVYGLPQCEKYRKKLKAFQKEAFKNILGYKNPNIEQYGFYIQARIHDYNNFSMLLGDIEVDMGTFNEED